MGATETGLGEPRARAELGPDRGERVAPAAARRAVGPQHLADTATSLSQDEATALARRLRVFASPNRLRILWELLDGEKRVGELARRLGISSSLTSYQLRLMREAELTVTRKAGTRVYYRLHDTNLRELLIAVRAHHASLTLARVADVAFAREQAALTASLNSTAPDLQPKPPDAIAD